MGLAAIAGGVLSILYFPLHSLASFATEDGVEGTVKWADSGRDLLEPLLDWDSADTVYRTYGSCTSSSSGLRRCNLAGANFSDLQGKV